MESNEVLGGGGGGGGYIHCDMSTIIALYMMFYVFYLIPVCVLFWGSLIRIFSKFEYIHL